MGTQHTQTDEQISIPCFPICQMVECERKRVSNVASLSSVAACLFLHLWESFVRKHLANPPLVRGEPSMSTGENSMREETVEMPGTSV